MKGTKTKETKTENEKKRTTINLDAKKYKLQYIKKECIQEQINKYKKSNRKNAQKNKTTIKKSNIKIK